jgi:hypothetical protein
VAVKKLAEVMGAARFETKISGFVPAVRGKIRGEWRVSRSATRHVAFAPPNRSHPMQLPLAPTLAFDCIAHALEILHDELDDAQAVFSNEEMA